jgi:hypothetical protein
MGTMTTELLPEQAKQPAPSAAPAIAAPGRGPGRRFVKGRSGNPAGRPPRGLRASYLAQAMIADKAPELTHKLIGLALGGDRAALKMCLDRLAPAPRAEPIALDLPPLVDDEALRAAMVAVVEAASRGALDVAHAATLARTLTQLLHPAGGISPAASPEETEAARLPRGIGGDTLPE